jgi:hypothetical protein
MRPTQLSDFGTDQSPMMTGQSSNIRIRWNRATNVKIAPANIENVLRLMGEHPNLAKTASFSGSSVRRFTNQLVVHPHLEGVSFGIEPGQSRTKQSCDPVYDAMN